jgi:hypothetical protein
MAGSLQFNQPGGAGVVAGGVVANNARVYPSLTGTTNTIASASLLNVPAGSSQVMQQPTTLNPYFNMDIDGGYTALVIDSAGTTYISSVIAFNISDLAAAPYTDE